MPNADRLKYCASKLGLLVSSMTKAKGIERRFLLLLQHAGSEHCVRRLSMTFDRVLQHWTPAIAPEVSASNCRHATALHEAWCCAVAESVRLIIASQTKLVTYAVTAVHRSCQGSWEHRSAHVDCTIRQRSDMLVCTCKTSKQETKRLGLRAVRLLASIVLVQGLNFVLSDMEAQACARRLINALADVAQAHDHEVQI